MCASHSFSLFLLVCLSLFNTRCQWRWAIRLFWSWSIFNVFLVQTNAQHPDVPHKSIQSLFVLKNRLPKWESIQTLVTILDSKASQCLHVCVCMCGSYHNKHSMYTLLAAAAFFLTWPWARSRNTGCTTLRYQENTTGVQRLQVRSRSCLSPYFFSIAPQVGMAHLTASLN